MARPSDGGCGRYGFGGEFVNDAIKEKLYFRRLDEELKLLELEGVKVNEAGYRWLLDRIDATDRRLAAGG